MSRGGARAAPVSVLAAGCLAAWSQRSMVGLLLVHGLSLPLMFAETTATVKGRITDTDGKVLPYVPVEIRNKSQPSGYKPMTDIEGNYRLPLLPPADDYFIKVDYPGFAVMELGPVVLKAGKTTVVDLTLRRTDPFPEEFAAPIERAHGLWAWWWKQGLKADIIVEYGGKRELEGSMLLETGSGRCRMELKTGQVLVWDGSEAWVAPAGAFPAARFHVRTWPYFLAEPMKLRDRGVTLSDAGSMPLQGRSMPAARLTFEAGVGDTPEDWYVIYRDPEAGALKAMAYIVTYGRSRQEAEKAPSMIVYDDFAAVDGVWLSRRWTFWKWSADQGTVGEPLGRVDLSNLAFVTPSPGAFSKPEGAAADPLPGR